MKIAGETAKNNDLKFCTKRDLFTYLYVDLFLLFFFQHQLIWTYWVFTSYFLILKILCPYLGASDFGGPSVFQNIYIYIFMFIRALCVCIYMSVYKYLMIYVYMSVFMFHYFWNFGIVLLVTKSHTEKFRTCHSPQVGSLG